VAGHLTRLTVDPRLFRPTLTTSILTESLHDRDVRGRTVLDLGCGVGPIAIGLALAGADHVYATDIMPDAIGVAARNARLNGVAGRITLRSGNLFEPVEGIEFDIIVDDVSGVAEDVARLSRWFPPNVPSGGVDGTSNTISMLRQARRYLKPGGHLLFPVLSLSRHQEIVSAARSEFGAGLVQITERKIPFNPELKLHLPRLRGLREQGLIDFDEVRSRPFWTLKVFKAMTGG
jgi:methylase of polypeptide subunit release factors